MTRLKPLARSLLWLALAFVVVFAYALSIRVTQPDLKKLVTSAPKAMQILRDLLRPDLVTRTSETETLSLAIPIPCGSAELDVPLAAGPRISAEPGCSAEREQIVLRGFDLGARTDVAIRWRRPDGRTQTVDRLTTSSDGSFEITVEARPIFATLEGAATLIEAEFNLPGGKLALSTTLRQVIDAMFVTVFMALLATTLGTVLAVPMSFLAASNITRRGLFGAGIYYLVRSILNVVRSYEPLVMATVFALIVGFDRPFAGLLALTIATIASLGKMFSESVEGIDPGPIEALTATGANRVQVILYAVVPQIVPDFLSFTIYHWDINVRISTIIGFVGGGGIGYYLSQRINSFEYTKAGAALLAIVIVVWWLDFLSAQVRKRLI